MGKIGEPEGPGCYVLHTAERFGKTPNAGVLPPLINLDRESQYLEVVQEYLDAIAALARTGRFVTSSTRIRSHTFQLP